MSFKAIYFSRFLPTPELGGGSRRMMQIQEMLRAHELGFQLVCNSRGDRIPEKIRKKIKKTSHRKDLFSPLRLSLSLRKWSADHRDMVYRLRKFSEIWVRSIKELPELDMAILDDPIYFLPLLKKLRRLHIPVIAVSHNLETLASNQVKKKWAMDLFKKELEILSRCRLVITLSREEAVLLRNLAIRSLYLPYYPVEPILGRLLAVREIRKHNSKEGILMVGTVKNLQTREGVVRAASYWHQNRLDRTAGKLIIGGYKSETFFDPRPFGDSVDFRGTLANEEMDHLLSRVKAFLCYQESGAGALTRICEMLIAGVPVLANPHAARSYYHRKGVIEFRELDELGEALKQTDVFDGEIPLPQAPRISPLSLEIQRILHENSHDLAGARY